MLLQDFNKSVSDIVRTDYRAADVFQKYAINYSGENTESLLEACTRSNLDYNAVLKELAHATRNGRLSNTLDVSAWKTDFLVDYIVNVHHAYMRKAIPAIEAALVALLEQGNKKAPVPNKLLFLLRQLGEVLMKHSMHEEEIIFPYIKQIESTHRRKEVYGNLFVRTLRKPLSNIEKEHEMIFSVLDQMQTLTNDYSCPDNGCTYQCVVYKKLREFHDDMMQHTYLEDEVLFPKAIAMEKELLQL